MSFSVSVVKWRFVALVYCAPFCVFADQAAPDIGAARATNRGVTVEAEFTVELNESRTANEIRVSVSETGVATVAVQLAPDAKRVTWSGPSATDQREKVRKELGKDLPSAVGGKEFHIKITFVGRPPIVRAWNSDGEYEPLRELRRDIELWTHVPYVVTQAFFQRGQADESAGSYIAATRSYRAGLAEMGELYSDANLLDDTGTKLVLAESNESKNNQEAAAAVYGRVLESRLRAYERKYRLKLAK